MRTDDLETVVDRPLGTPPHVGGSGRTVAGNVAWNWTGLLVELLVGFLVAPFLITRLGDTGYGLWIVIGSLTSYFGLLDLGIRSSVGQHVAVYQARKDTGAINRTLSTALTVLLLAATIASVGTVVLLGLMLRLVEVPPELVAPARLALLIVGINLSLSLVLNVFDAALWGMQRFDALNSIDIPTVLVRALLTVTLVGQGHGIVALAWITLGVTVGAGVAKMVVTMMTLPGVEIGIRHRSRESARQLFSYGSWNMLRNVAQTTRRTVTPVFIGGALGVAFVTPFSIASRLVGYAVLVMVTGAGVLTPIAASLHARARRDRQAQLLMEGAKFCFALALWFAVLLTVLGPLLVQLWMGRAQSTAITLLAVLVLGELLPMSQLVGEGLLLGTARHRSLAVFAVVELAGGLALAASVVDRGLLPVCVGFAIAATLCRGVGTAVAACRATGTPLIHFIRHAMLTPLAALAPPAALLLALERLWPAQGWAGLVLHTAAFGACSAATCLALVPPELRTRMRRLVVATVLPV